MMRIAADRDTTSIGVPWAQGVPIGAAIEAQGAATDMMGPTARLILGVVRRQAARLAAWMDHLWQGGAASPDQGQAIGPGEVARLLAHDATRSAEAAFHAARRPADCEDAELAADPLWRRMLELFALAPREADLLALLLAVELDPGLGRVMAYLHDDRSLPHPTPFLAARLAGREPAPFLGDNLRRWHLAAPAEDTRQIGAQMAVWQADPAALLAVTDGVWRDPAIIVPHVAAPAAVLHPAGMAALLRLHDPRDAELCGPPGIGKRSLAAQFAARHGRALLAVDLRAAPEGHAAQVIAKGLRAAAMQGALAYFATAELASEENWAAARALGVAYLAGARHPTGRGKTIQLAPLPIKLRLAFWETLSAAPAPARLITRRLTPAEIVAAASEGGRAAASRARLPDHALLSRLPTPYGWEDLVLQQDVLALLRAFEAQLRLRWQVYEDWDFGRLTHLGQGISALFGGLSGTGKTMAAQVLAASLGLDLLRVDLAGVVNKYIGETEKKLREVFDACEDSGALLFFDEADALFGNRTQVKDAHDRFANIEIDYLLQRIERFDGIAILATNRRQDIDPAFIRRLRFVIEFMPPGPAERLVMWRRALGPAWLDGQPILGEIDVGELAARLIMTGAEIKNTVLAAAFLAHEGAGPIGMRHIYVAAQREMEKKGERLRIPVREAAE